MKETIEFKLNGKPTRLNVDPRRKLLWVLRGDLGLTGSKYGCGEGHCGACTVLVGRMAVRSCLVSVRAIAGKEVTTIEGLETRGELHPLQKAFMQHDALQCGFCTPGMIMNAYGLLLETPQPSRQQIIDKMEGNLCRCAAHPRIVAAIQTAARQMQGGAR